MPDYSFVLCLGGACSDDANTVSDVYYDEEIACVDLDDALEVSIPIASGSQTDSFERLLRWGIRRKPDNQVPEADPGTRELLGKYRSFFVGDSSKKTVYLTFDEGYEAGYTAGILDVLKANDIKAAFFITGHYLKKEGDLVKRMLDEGHIVGNHTVNHKCLPALDEEGIKAEVMGLDKLFFEKFGSHMVFLRPPKGEYSERSLKITNELGYRNVFWSFAYDDWFRDKIRGAEYAYEKVIKNLHNGSIMLLHAVSRDNLDALDRIIKDIKQKGYTFGTLDEL